MSKVPLQRGLDRRLVPCSGSARRASSRRSFSHVGVGERDLTKDPASAEQKGAVGKNKSRVFAFGRFSIVDYEEHYYVSQFAKPTKPPAA